MVRTAAFVNSSAAICSGLDSGPRDALPLDLALEARDVDADPALLLPRVGGGGKGVRRGDRERARDQPS